MLPMEERPVYVRFEYRAVEDREASIKEGRYVPKDVVFAMITPPGGNLVVDRIAEEWLDSKRNDKFYQHYLGVFRAWKEGEAEPEFGASLRSWPAISPAQVAQCFAANVKTIEDLATANAQALQRIGMGSVGLQQKALAYLQSAEDHGKTAEKISTLTRDVEALSSRNAELTAQVEALLAAQGGRPKAKTKEPKEIVL